MKTALATLESISPYSQSRPHTEPKLEKEKMDDYEKRTWTHKAHVTEDGHIFIPPMALKNCLAEGARFLGEKISGKGQATYTKHFLAGVLVTDGLVLPIKASELKGEWLYMNANGKKGVGTRVWRCFPLIPKWSGDVTFHILDETITEPIFRRFLEQSGQFIGIGRFRPIVGGFYGRFVVKALKWS